MAKDNKSQGQSFKKWENKNFLDFTLKDDGEEKGVITGTLIKHSVIDSYGDVFTRESLDLLSKAETRFLLHTHNWQNELGTLTVKQDSEGHLIFAGKLDLTLNDAGLPNNPEAHKIYSLMKQGATYQMSAGGNYMKAGFGDFETSAGTIKAYLIDEFSLSEGSICIKGAVPGAGVEAVKMDNQENINKEGEENMSKKIEKAEVEEVKETETKTPEVTEEPKATEQVPENTGDIEKKVNEMVEKRLGEEMEKINTEIRKGISVDMTKTADKTALNNFDKYLRTGNFEKVNRSTTGVLIPEPQSQEILKELKEESIFFGMASVKTGQGSKFKFPVRKDDRNNSVEQVKECEGNTIDGDLEFTYITVGAEVLQNRFPLTDEARDDISYNIIGEISTATVEDFGEKLGQLVTKGVLVSDVNEIQGFLNHTETIKQATESAGTVTQRDLIKLTRNKNMKAKYRKTAKLYVSPDLYTEMELWEDKNGRPLLTQTQTADGTIVSRFKGYEIIEEPYLEDVKMGNFPAFFGDFEQFYGFYVRIDTFETAQERKENIRTTLYYTRCRMGGNVIRPKAGAILQIS